MGETLLVVAVSRLRDGAVAAEDDVALEGVGTAKSGLAGGAGEGVVVGVAGQMSVPCFSRNHMGVRNEGLGSRHEGLADDSSSKVRAYKDNCAPAKALADKMVPIVRRYFILRCGG